jgi:hypothetical protein
MKIEQKQVTVDLVIIGAGLAGICTAIQASRKGLKVAIINDRGVLGGNASCEIGVRINGASDGGPVNLNSREGGVISEILTDYNYRTPLRENRYILDGVLLDKVRNEANIQLFLNTCIDEVLVDNHVIKKVIGTQNTTETKWEFEGKYFVDNTGDGTIGYLAGNEYMLGREAKSTFNERIAPDEADSYVLPSTLTFHAKDVGYKVSFKAPKFAFDISKSDVLERRIIPVEGFQNFQWWYEVGGDYDHVKDREQIIIEHKALVFGIWDYIKNSGKYPEADTYDFEYISCIPGTREYRRLVGDYILTENDLINQTAHNDTVAHGGWNIDLHAIKGFTDEDIINRHIHLSGIYQVPYRTLFAKNIDNLFMCGRCMSCSHVAFGSSRVMATLSTMGQAVGMAAYIAHKYQINPRDIYTSHLKELQQELLREDQYIVGVRNLDENDLALQATVHTTSTAKLQLTVQNHVDVDVIVQSIPDEYRSRNRRKYEGYSDCVTLHRAIGLSIPIVNSLQFLKVLVRASEDTVLSFMVYKPKVRESYGPDDLLLEHSIPVPATEDFHWIELPIHIQLENYYVWVELKMNPNIDVAISGKPLPSTMMFTSNTNHNSNVVSLVTLEMVEKTWQRSPMCLCFTTVPEQQVFEGQHVVNGYNRPYGKPNMWLSETDPSKQELTLKWDKKHEINHIQITFAVDLTKRLTLESFDEVLDLVAQHYSVYAKIESEYRLVADIRDNYEKVNRLEFDTAVTDEIRFVFHKAPTDQVGVYEIRAYYNGK